MFIGPPDTTGVTQLLDQVNQSFHTEYRNAKTQMFLKFATINREGFMETLAEIWGTWTTPEKLDTFIHSPILLPIPWGKRR